MRRGVRCVRERRCSRRSPANTRSTTSRSTLREPRGAGPLRGQRDLPQRRALPDRRAPRNRRRCAAVTRAREWSRRSGRRHHASRRATTSWRRSSRAVAAAAIAPPGGRTSASWAPSCSSVRSWTARTGCTLKARTISQFLLISTFSPWSVVPEASLVKVPEDVPLETVCLLGCGVGTGFGSASNAAGVRPGRQRDRRWGSAASASTPCRARRIAGAAAVVAVDPVPFKREMAEKLGRHARLRRHRRGDRVRPLASPMGRARTRRSSPWMARPARTWPPAFEAISKGGTVVVTGMASHHTPPGIPVSLLMLAGYGKAHPGLPFRHVQPGRSTSCARSTSTAPDG